MNLTAEQQRVLKHLSVLGVGCASQLATTDSVLETLERLGLVMPRRRRDPLTKLWQPTRRGDAYALELTD
jgi:hypothetical protein